MVQDNFGFLWIGTRDGLNRFDGHTFEQFHFNNKDTSALAFTEIHSIHVRANGNVVIGSVGGISIFDQENATFNNIFLPDNMSTAVVTNLSGDSTSVHIATTRGIISFDLLRSTFFRDESYRILNGLHITQFKSSQTFGEWIGTTKGLYRKLPGENGFTHFIQDTLINNLTVSDKEIFISTNRGLFQYRTGHPEFKRITLPPDFYNVLCARRTYSGEIWVASNRVLILSPDGLTIKHTLSHQNDNYRSLSEDRARILYETRDSVMWIGTFGYGLNKHNPRVRKIEHFGTTGTLRLSSAYVSAIYTPNDTLMFVGTSRGVNIIDRQKQTNTVFDPQTGSVRKNLFLVYAIKADSNGVIWMSGSGGLYSWRDNRFVFENVELGEIVDFLEFDRSSLLLMTRTSGCYLFNKRTKALSEFIAEKDLSSDLQTASMYGNMIWIGARDGLRKFNKQGMLERHYTASLNDTTALSSNVIKSLIEDESGTLWIGTWGGGLSKFNNASETFKTFTMNDGLPSNVVYGALEDNQGFLWLPTNNGISAFSPAKTRFKNFDVRDGLQSNEFNTGAYFKSRYGRIYLGGINGLNSFDPSQTLAPQQIANAQLTAITLEDDRGSKIMPMLGHSGNIQLNWYENTITLHLSIVDFRVAHKYKLQYAVNTEPWKDLGKARRIDLTGLAPETYVVMTRTSVDGYRWTDPSHLMTIEVFPPFWKHPLALVTLIGAIIMIVYVGQRIRVRNLTKRNESLDKLVQSRTHEVRQKNEEIAAQNDELLKQSDELAHKNRLLEQHKVELEAFQKELEQRVNDRTRDIQNLNVELTKQNAQLEQFSFITAHNFKGPIARIKGLINLLSESKLPNDDFERIRGYLRISIEDLDSVTHDLNTILHIKSTPKEEFKVTDLRVVLNDVLLKLGNEIRSSGIIIEINGFNDCLVLGVSAFIHSVFYNLLENAIKYRTRGSVPMLAINCIQLDEFTTIEIADNGIGIDMTFAEPKIFGIYQRFNHAPGGRGLGLYMVKTQMEMMGGNVAVESQLGKGTKFSLTFLKPRSD